MSGVLLDTCALLWVFGGDDVAASGRDAIAEAADAHALFVSPVSAWEIGLLARPGNKEPLRLPLPPEAMFSAVLALPGVRLMPLSPVSAIRASYLPDPLHKDPADRMLIAVARDEDLVLATRDRKILDYAARGHVKAVRC